MVLILSFSSDLLEMISSLRREHLKRGTFQLIVKRDRVLEDVLRSTFNVDLEVMVRSIQFFHNALLPSYIHMYMHVSPFRFPLLKMVMIVEGLLESSSHCCQKKL